VVGLSIRDYLRERAAESRHDEMSAYLMFIAGSILFVGGVLETSMVANTLEWVLFIPIDFSAAPGTTLGLALTLSGLALAVFGLVTGIHFARDRAWYMKELGNNSYAEGNVMASKKAKKKSGSSSSTRSPPKPS
jgi:hypothetical protein